MSNKEILQPKSEASPSSVARFADRQSANGHALQAFVRVLTKRWRWIFGSVVVCLLWAVIATLLMKPIYEATATIELNKSDGGLDLGLGDMLSSQLSAGGDTLLTDQQTETAILRGDSLALAVIQRLGLASQPPFLAQGGAAKALNSEKGLPLEESPKTRTRLLRIFKAGLKVNPVRGTRLIQVTYESHDPKQAAQIANALIESYKNQYLQTHYDATSEASDWLTNQLSELKANVEDSEKKLTDFEKETGILSLDIMPTGSSSDSMGEGQIHSVVIQKLDALNAELTAAEANRIEKEAIYRLVQSGNGDVILGLENDPLAVQSNSMVFTQGGGTSNLQQLKQQQNELKISIAEAATTYGANNRHLKEMEIQLRALNEQINQELQQIAKRAKADLQLAQQTESVIHQRFDQQQVEASKLNEKTVQFAVLSQEAFSRKKLYEDLYTKLQEANVSAGIKSTNITIADPARIQSIPVRPKRVSNLALGAFIGFFIGFAAAYTIDNFDRTVSDPLEVERITGRPLLGVIPDFRRTGKAYGTQLAHGAQWLKRRRTEVTEEAAAFLSVWILDHPASAVAEAFRALRTSIMLSRTGGGPKVILVTSCLPGEGKTTLTANLGVAYAQYNKRVIVVEADMRRSKIMPSPHNQDKVALGLSSVLTGSCTSDEVIRRGVYVPTLDVLPAGPHPPLPSEILGSRAFDELLEKLRSCYDIILVDSPPALVVTDAASISSKADAVVWVAQAGIVTRQHLDRATYLIEGNKMPVVGFVVNRMSKNVAGYGYESYDSYYEKQNPHDA